MNDKEFLNFKNQTLKGIDLSKKGQVDEYISKLINIINSNKSYVTLSSCSGRTIVVSQDPDKIKKGCQWIYSTHDYVETSELIKSCENFECDLIIKFEPFILHVACQNLECAKKLLSCAINNGYRNSGIVPGACGKITLAVRSTLNMEVPISTSGKLLVSQEFLQFIGDECNKKMDKNLKQIKKFETCLAEILT